MKKLIITSLIVAMVVGIGIVFATNDETGNGCPSGAHYNLNIIGMDKPKKGDPDPEFPHDSGHRIFVALGSRGNKATTKIWLEPGDFAVLDYDGTDGDATFQLPNPDPQNTGTTEYSVYLRLVGKPGGKLKMYTAATDPDIGEVTSDLQVIRVVTKGPRKFSNVSEELLYIYAWHLDTSGQTATWVYARFPLFDPRLEDYLWYYQNEGVRVAQLRFYEGVQTTVRDPENVPHLHSISPYQGTQGDVDLDVTITGALTTFNDVANPVVDVDFGDDITVVTTIVDADTLDCEIDIDGAAETGWRTVVVTYDDGSHMTIWFEVLAL